MMILYFQSNYNNNNHKFNVMNTNYFKVLLSCFLLIIVTIFSLSIDNSSLESLRANAKIAPAYCDCPKYNSDCLSVETGAIYPNLKRCGYSNTIDE
ncbi:hypothetical protein JUNP353_3303 [Elizabethkingia anophelis]|nr:hypothetical protein JUNP353_3303 [Elizabethkingia anophelis]